MITLYGFGPAMGLPEISPFVTKAHILLQMAGLPYETETSFGGFLKAPKGKLPYIRDDGARRFRLDLHPVARREKIRLRLRPGFKPRREGDRLGLGADVRRASLLADHRRPLARQRELSRRPGKDFRFGFPPRSGRWSKPMSAAPFAGRSICKASAGTTQPPASTWPRAICARFPTLSPTSLTCLAMSRAARTHPSALSSSGRSPRSASRRCATQPSPCPISSPTPSECPSASFLARNLTELPPGARTV